MTRLDLALFTYSMGVGLVGILSGMPDLHLLGLSMLLSHALMGFVEVAVLLVKQP